MGSPIRRGRTEAGSKERSGRSSRLFSSINNRAAVFRPTPGTVHSVSRSSSNTAVDNAAGREHRHDRERQRRPHPVGAQQHLEATALVVVHEAVEDDGVLADVGVHVQRRLWLGCPAATSVAAAEGVTVTRYPTPATSTITSHSPVRSTTGPRSNPITAGSSRC